MLKIMLAAAVLAMPVAAFAHGTPPAATHGGQVAEDAGENWVEVVIKGDRLAVYVLDEAKAQVPKREAYRQGHGAGPRQVPVRGADTRRRHQLLGKLDPAATGKVTAVLSLSVDGKQTQARIAVQL